jgi:hypothetical protein
MKQILNILKQFTDKKNPKVELRYVYYDSNKNQLIATDTRRLLIIEPNEKIMDTDVFVDVNNIATSNRPKIFYKNILCYFTKKIGNYPNVEKILKQVLSDSKSKEYRTQLDLASVILNVGSIIKNQTIIQFDKKFSSLEKIKSNKYIIKYKNNKEPVVVECNYEEYKITLVVMPYKENY